MSGFRFRFCFQGLNDQINTRPSVAEIGLWGSMYIFKYMNRLEFSSNMDVLYFYKIDYVNIAE